MKRVDFVIANDGHHSAGALPVIRELRRLATVDVRIGSLCELRGLPSPVQRYAEMEIPLTRLVPFNLRRSPASGSSPRPSGARGLRPLARSLIWNLVLGPRVARFFSPPPDAVVLPNDGAFPYDRISKHLARCGVPHLILQEGIRFDTPAASTQGGSGASAFALWGETSMAFFAGQGAPRDRLFASGAPRFDTLLETDWQGPAEELRSQLRLGAKNLVLVSSPIDDLGFVSTDQKHDLIRRFLSELVELWGDPEFGVVIKLHHRESIDQVNQVLSTLPVAARVRVAHDVPLYPLLRLSDGAVTFASTVGLEALLLGTRLAVLEIPGHGFVHDFVSSGAAKGLGWGPGIGADVAAWISQERPEAEVSHYLAASLANQGRAARAVSGMILELARAPCPPAAG